MRIADRAIVLQNIRRGDNQFILKLFTLQNGLVTAAARVSRKTLSGIKAAHIQPMSIIEVQLLIKQNKEIQQLTEATLAVNLDGIISSFPKIGIAQFINEVLIKSLKEQQANGHLFEFTETCLKYLNDAENKFVNVHLYFLYELTKYLGFEPQNNLDAGQTCFDLRNGCFTPAELAFPLGLNQQESLLFSEFLKNGAPDSDLTLQQRRRILEILLAYYSFHVPGFGEVKSLGVLKEVMNP